MDALVRLVLRMALWVRQPPSRQHVIVMAMVVVIAAFCLGFEALFGWPETLTVERGPRQIPVRP